jgi:hypothetical protein
MAEVSGKPFGAARSTRKRTAGSGDSQTARAGTANCANLRQFAFDRFFE